MIFTENVQTPPFVTGLSRSAGVEVETDARLLESARRMDREALVRIFDLYSTSLYSYALRLCHDPLMADHIVGDVFAKFLEQLSMGKGPETHLRAYLYQMAYHLVVDDARYSSRRTSLCVVGFPVTDQVDDLARIALDDPTVDSCAGIH